MFPIDSIECLLQRCNSEQWGGRIETQQRFNDRMLKIYRWEHRSSRLGFVLCHVVDGGTLVAEDVQGLVKLFRHWRGKNLGVLFVLSVGLASKGAHALPYYGHMRCSIIDLIQERIHHGSDSKKFQLLVNCIARELGIPCGGEIDYWVQSQHYNRLGPRTWTRMQLQKYAIEDILSWHPLYLASCFSGVLKLGLNSTLHFGDTIFILNAMDIPIGSSEIRAWRHRYSQRSLVLLHRASLTEQAQGQASEINVKCIKTKDPIQFFEKRLNTVAARLTEEGVCKRAGWSPILWSSYYRSISGRCDVKFLGQVCCIEESEFYLSAGSMRELLDNLNEVPSTGLFVLHTNFHVPDNIFERFERWVWFYRDEVYGAAHLPVSKLHAFCHFNSITVLFKSREERFYEKPDGQIVDHWTGRTVELIENIPQDYEKLGLCFLISMHSFGASCLFYYPQENLLIRESFEEEVIWSLSSLRQLHAIIEALYLLGISASQGVFLRDANNLVFLIEFIQILSEKSVGSIIPSEIWILYPQKDDLLSLLKENNLTRLLHSDITLTVARDGAVR